MLRWLPSAKMAARIPYNNSSKRMRGCEREKRRKEGAVVFIFSFKTYSVGFLTHILLLHIISGAC